jgi:hypothetical protein
VEGQAKKVILYLMPDPGEKRKEKETHEGEDEEMSLYKNYVLNVMFSCLTRKH